MGGAWNAAQQFLSELEGEPRLAAACWLSLGEMFSDSVGRSLAPPRAAFSVLRLFWEEDCGIQRLDGCNHCLALRAAADGWDREAQKRANQFPGSLFGM